LATPGKRIVTYPDSYHEKLFARNGVIEKNKQPLDTDGSSSCQHYKHKIIIANQRRNHSITRRVQMPQTEKEAKDSG
jgi:hypothetical protein